MIGGMGYAYPHGKRERKDFLGGRNYPVNGYRFFQATGFAGDL